MSCRNQNQKPWSFRRRVVVTTLLFCASVVVKVAVWGHKSDGIGEALVTMAFGLAGAVIGSYIFGAVWNDKWSNDENREDRQSVDTGWRRRVQDENSRSDHEEEG